MDSFKKEQPLTSWYQILQNLYQLQSQYSKVLMHLNLNSFGQECVFRLPLCPWCHFVPFPDTEREEHNCLSVVRKADCGIHKEITLQIQLKNIFTVSKITSLRFLTLRGYLYNNSDKLKQIEQKSSNFWMGASIQDLVCNDWYIFKLSLHLICLNFS